MGSTRPVAEVCDECGSRAVVQYREMVVRGKILYAFCKKHDDEFRDEQAKTRARLGLADRKAAQ